MKLSENWLSLMGSVVDEGEIIQDLTGPYLEVSMLGLTVTDFDSDNLILTEHIPAQHIIEMRKVFLGGDKSAFAHDYWGQIGGNGQLDRALNELRHKPTSRKAVVVLGLSEHTSSVPCINALHFQLRDNVLNLHYFSRGQDLWLKYVPDILALRDLQHLAADMLEGEIGVGAIAGTISSAHIYVHDLEKVRALLKK